MRIGFTGTQRGMTVAQRFEFVDLLRGKAGWLHHGDCVGADAGAHSLACDLGFLIALHPPESPSKRAWCRPAAVTHPPKPYLDRNKDIVRGTECLIAAPGEDQEQLRSGTWSTVRFARKLKRPIAIIYPDGHCAYENGFLDEIGNLTSPAPS
jgi:hypothetical protein